MLPAQTASPLPDRSSLLRNIVSLLIINVAIPFGCYAVLKAYHASDVTALGVAAIAPALDALISVLRGRRINIISLFVLGGLIIGISAIFLGGDPRVLLIRESFFTGALGITCFVSLLFPRPLMFSVGRSMLAGKDPEHIARYNQLWQNPSARHTSRVTTVVWGIVYSGDFLLRLLLVLTLPIAVVLVVGPILTGSLIGVSLLWTFAYLRRARQRVQTMQTTPLHAGEEALPESGTRPASVPR
jgi:hypothetical protein